MENKQRYNGHTLSRLTVHLVWVTKYRYKVLEGDIKLRGRTWRKQICDAEGIAILSGVVSTNPVPLHIQYPPVKSIRDIVNFFKGRTSKRIQEDFSRIGKKYWGKHFGAIGYGV
jgi:putative transposase